VQVAPWALDPHLRREKFTPRLDEEVAQAVRDTLNRDPRTHAFPLLVHVRDGVATLAGIVSSLGAQHAAEQDARHVVGVWDVHNLLRVRPERTWTAPFIRQAIAGALARDPYLGDVDFTVNVLEGKAYLYGRVSSRYEQDHACRLAANTIGVVAVESHLTIRHYDPGPAPGEPAAPPTDHALAERVRTRYFWSASLHAQPIEVRVEHGRATLTGTVDTWLARQLAAREACEAGVREVNNHLTVHEGKSSHT
jgi:osmotically-inducible protein OsmY